MQEVLLVPKEGVHPCSGHTQDIPGVLVNAALQIQNFVRTGQKGSLIRLGLGVFLKGPSIGIGVHLLSIEKKQSNLVEVFMLQALADVRKALMCCHEGTVLPNAVLKDHHVDLVMDVQGKVFQPIEQGSQPGGLARAYARQRGYTLFGEDFVNADGEDEPAVSRIFGRGCHC